MQARLARNWWVLALRGLAAVIFGILVFVLPPPITLSALILVLGVYLLVDGIAAVISAFNHRTADRNWWVTLLEGIVSIIAGLIAAFGSPTITALAILWVLAAWAIITGVFEIWAAISLRKEIEGELLLGLTGILSIIFGVLLILFPGAGILTVLALIGGYSIVFGILMIILAFRLRGMATTTTTGGPVNRPV
jgi:uncharacterized membrane protein HdeD (DUF308 family)